VSRLPETRSEEDGARGQVELPQVLLPVQPLNGEAAADRAGDVRPEGQTYAAAVRDNFPEVLREAAEEPFRARALVYALVLGRADPVRAAQLARIAAEAEPGDHRETLRLAGPAASLPDALRLPLLDVAVPALRRMSPRQYATFRPLLQRVIDADGRLDTFEYVLGCVLERDLDQGFGHRRARAERPRSDREVRRQVVEVLSVLAWHGQLGEAEARSAFDAGTRAYLRADGQEPMLPHDEATLPVLERALRRLAGTPPEVKRRVLAACAACIAADQQVTVREAELYRAVGDMLGCPIPPLAVGTAQPPEKSAAGTGRRLAAFDDVLVVVLVVVSAFVLGFLLLTMTLL
jgi:hypothetical protein